MCAGSEADAGPAPKRQRLDNSASALDAQGGNGQELHNLGDPLPVHKFVLRACSERFAAELRRWQQGSTGGGAHAEQAAGSSSGHGGAGGRPVLRVPLGSPAELPAALAALRFAYTGCVEAGSVTEALEVRRQAAYLRIEGCGAACMERIRGLLGAAAAETEQPQPQQPEQVQQQQAGQGGGGARIAAGTGGRAVPSIAGTLGPVPPPLLEFFRVSALWPEEAEEPAFSGVLALAKQRLVAHFQDTLLVLNSPCPHEALRTLPTVALAALLESDDFGTDDEASVLLMLALWMDKNYATTDAETRRRLCRRVRLVQVNRPYLTAVLPVLAMDHAAGPPKEEGKEEEDEAEEEAVEQSTDQSAAREPQPLTEERRSSEGPQPIEESAVSEEPPEAEDQPAVPDFADWFPITVAEATFIASVASTTSDIERMALEGAVEDLYDLQSPWYSTEPRRQCLPEGGLVYRWSVPQAVLEGALSELELDGGIWLGGRDDWSSGHYASGFYWEQDIYVQLAKSHMCLTLTFRTSSIAPCLQ